MKLAIGTVQFGLDYGISNNIGQTIPEEVQKILSLAKQNKIDTLDSASAYGNSEEILGEFADNYFKIITKVQTPENFSQSLKKLKWKNIYGLMFHNIDILIKNKDYWHVFEKYKKENKVEKIGVSVYSKEEIDFILNNFDIDIIQIPINILDQRLLQNGYLKKLKDKDIEIHARSVFLQGLLLMDLVHINSYFDLIKPLLIDYFSYISQNNVSKTEAALCFVKNIKEIDKIVIGVNNHIQLQENISAYNKSIELDFKQFAINDENFINPAKWRI